MKYYEITYPDYINEVSEILGRKRRDASESVRMSNKKYQCDTEEEEIKIDVMGIKGEIIASHFLFSRGVEHQMNKLVDDKPISDYDIMINGKKIDVKSVPFYGKLLLVDYDSHKKKKMDYYMFIKIHQNNTAEIWLISYKTVGSWKRTTLGNGLILCDKIENVNKKL